MFITRALEKILNDREIKRSYHSQLRKACELALEEIKNEIKNQAPSDQETSSALPLPKGQAGPGGREIPAAFRTGLPVQKLLIDRIVETICGCFQGPTTDDGVQLQIIKALLTVVTSQWCEVHEGSVLQPVRTCYNIYLASRNLVNQTTAIATLTQMLNVIFARMEACSAANGSTVPMVGTSGMPITTTLPATITAQTELGTADTDSRRSDKIGLPQDVKDQTENFSSATPTSIVEPSQTPPPAPSSVTEDSAAEEDDTSSVTDDRSHGESSEEVVASVLQEILNRVVAGSGDAPTSSSTTSSTLPRAGSQESVAASCDGGSAAMQAHFAHVVQKDAFLVFRSLCKLSMKPLPEGQPDP
ncbi:hypothetical protein MTO96_039048, partial [Rhipicephalus appendiculatus]